jgi:excisionase family DNA binding protein
MAETYDLSPAQVAEILGVRKETVRAWADTGKLPCWRTPTGYRRFRQSDVDALIAKGQS